jgi:hypothetical protein
MDVAAATEVDAWRRGFWLLFCRRCRRGIAAGTANRNFARFDLVDYQLLAGRFRYRSLKSLETGLRNRARPADSVSRRGTKDAVARGSLSCARLVGRKTRRALDVASSLELCRAGFELCQCVASPKTSDHCERSGCIRIPKGEPTAGRGSKPARIDSFNKAASSARRVFRPTDY